MRMRSAERKGVREQSRHYHLSVFTAFSFRIPNISHLCFEFITSLILLLNLYDKCWQRTKNNLSFFVYILAAHIFSFFTTSPCFFTRWTSSWYIFAGVHIARTHVHIQTFFKFIVTLFYFPSLNVYTLLEYTKTCMSRAKPKFWRMNVQPCIYPSLLIKYSLKPTIGD